jgi:murein tripeptide amidase MpaA
VQNLTLAHTSFAAKNSAFAPLSRDASALVSSQLVFIDAAVQDHMHLAAGVNPGAEVIVLHPDEDGVTQISLALAGRTHISSIHLVAHGSPGSLQLGNAQLSHETLIQYQAQLQQWRNALGERAELLIYGCRVADTAVGIAFLQALKSLIGVEVAASTTAVGNSAQGGNWDLDARTGGMTAALAFLREAIATYPGILEEPETYFAEDFSGASGATPPPGWTVNVIEGNPETDLWRFDNPGNRDEINQPFNPDFDNPVAVYDSDFLSDDDVAENIALESPVFDVSDAEAVILQFDQVYGGIAAGINASEVFVEAYNGTEWQSVYSSNTGNYDINTPIVDLTEALSGSSEAQVRFRFDGNWSYLWALDNVRITDNLASGVTTPSGLVGVSESNVSDPLDFQFALQSRPTSDVTLSFTVDGEQLQPIQSITFTEDNWFVPQTSVVQAIADDIVEGEDQSTSVTVTVTSDDPNYKGLVVEDVPVEITETTIPGYTSYRTVEKTYSDLSELATLNPNLARWVDIGDSYDKATPGGAEGYDIYSLEITNQNSQLAEEKPIFFVQGAIHAREYSTTEAVTRFAEQLIANYGTDPDTTWILDNFEVRVVPIVNPDGRKFAEQGYSWRKNTNPGDGTAEFPNYGVDLNRNYASKWGEIGEEAASTDPADLTYQGTAPFSEPESQALRDYLLETFPDTKGPDDFDPASEDTSGVYIDVHSFGDLILYPFGWTDQPAPNQEALRNLGLKFGYFTGLVDQAYDVSQAIGLYPTSGTTDDWVYSTLGVPGYTFELGTAFFQDTETFESTIVNEVIPAFFYAAKSARSPYKTAGSPDVTGVKVDLSQVLAGATVELSATADSTRKGDGITGTTPDDLEIPEPEIIGGARYSIGAPSWAKETTTFELFAADGAFDEAVEELTGTIDTTGFGVGRYTVFVESADADGNYGVPTAVFLDVLEAPSANATVFDGDAEADRYTGGSGSDTIYGRDSDDVLAGGLGDDLIIGGDGNDLLRGDKNTSSSVSGPGGDDVIYGGRGSDRISGKRGDDKLYGDAGDDVLYGDAGDDLLWGGAGRDRLYGGAGSDTYTIGVGGGTDYVQGFEVGKDLIGLVGTLSFGQLSVTQERNNTLIKYGDDVFAVLNRVNASALSEATFVPV